jgi:hypothetical protein
VLIEYFRTGLVDRLPTWILAVALSLMALVAFVSGVILDSVARGRAEQKRVHYLTLKSGFAPTAERTDAQPAAKTKSTRKVA